MGRFGGYPGMNAGNMNNLLRQAQKMQADMMKTQSEVEEKEVEGTSGGGAVVVKMNVKNVMERVITMKLWQ